MVDESSVVSRISSKFKKHWKDGWLIAATHTYGCLAFWRSKETRLGSVSWSARRIIG